MRTEEIVGAEKVFNALLDGRELTAVAGDVKMQTRGGLLIIRSGGRVTTVNIEDTPYTYPVPELKEGGKYKTRRGECVLLSAAPKRYGLPWAGLVFHENSVEAALYFENGSIYSTKPHPLDIMSEWDEE